MKQVQLIWAHPRSDSLTATVAEAVKDELVMHGWSVAELDLYRAGFNPVLTSIDEPDWSTLDNTYSDEVMKLAAELTDKDAAFIVFPVWWFSSPAILKGYIDRVWNYGIFYGGDRRLPFDSVRWIALAGTTEEAYAEYDLDKSVANLFNIGIAKFCGAEDSKVTILYDTLGEKAKDPSSHNAQLIERARQVVIDWAK